jgi:hypothetical protein
VKLLTALGLCAALLLTAEPVVALGESLQASRIQTDHNCDASGSCEYSIPPEYQTQYLLCRMSGKGLNNISQTLYCANLYSHMAPSAPTSTPTPVATPSPAPSPTVIEVDCRVTTGRLSYEGTYGGRQEYSLQLGIPSFREKSPCVNQKITWFIEYPSGRIRRESKRISLSGSSFLYLERTTKAVVIWVRSNGAQTAGCYPQTRWCD